MNTKLWLLQICLVMLFTKISSQHCDQLHGRLQEANKANLELLESNMGATIPLQCIGDITDFSTVNEENLMSMDKASHGEIAKIAIQEMLQQADLIFKQVHAELFWDENTLRQFHTALDQQIKKLEICQNAGVGGGTISPRDQKLQLTRLRVKRYFQRVNDFLKDKKYSLCAWAIVQIQLRECFLLINQLIQRIPTEDHEVNEDKQVLERQQTNIANSPFQVNEHVKED
ncbi:interferon alpha-21-like [Candoia aspera]|uniref:interferon alpha-21-like n=1 Tax=Candoia aspera TaxID=51853 RepID=UPI002FD7FEFB